MKRLITLSALMLAGLTLTGLAGSAATAKSGADPKSLASNQCFRMHDVRGSVQVNESRLNILTDDHRYIRVDTVGRCFSPPYIDPYIVQVHGSDMVCSPIDLDLSAGPAGFQTPCIVDRISQMSPAEVAALPRKDKP